MLDETDIGLQINPLFFQYYHIEHVPAAVMEDNEGFNVVYSDVPLESDLDTLNKAYK